jgi:hypothetical protein
MLKNELIANVQKVSNLKSPKTAIDPDQNRSESDAIFVLVNLFNLNYGSGFF